MMNHDFNRAMVELVRPLPTRSFSHASGSSTYDPSASLGFARDRVLSEAWLDAGSKAAECGETSACCLHHHREIRLWRVEYVQHVDEKTLTTFIEVDAAYLSLAVRQTRETHRILSGELLAATGNRNAYIVAGRCRAVLRDVEVAAAVEGEIVRVDEIRRGVLTSSHVIGDKHRRVRSPSAGLPEVDATRGSRS